MNTPKHTTHHSSTIQLIKPSFSSCWAISMIVSFKGLYFIPSLSILFWLFTSNLLPIKWMFLCAIALPLAFIPSTSIFWVFIPRLGYYLWRMSITSEQNIWPPDNATLCPSRLSLKSARQWPKAASRTSTTENITSGSGTPG